jgi:phage head maturation protease
MTLATDDRGLLTDADWNPEDRDAITWAARVRRGDANQMSFAFTVKEDKWEEDSETGEETRTLLTAERLYDVSLVTYPAYPGTDGGMRGDDQAAAEVVLRHRGIDPRKPAPVVIDLAPVHEDLVRRHRFNAARLGLPI